MNFDFWLHNTNNSVLAEGYIWLLDTNNCIWLMAVWLHDTNNIVLAEGYSWLHDKNNIVLAEGYVLVTRHEQQCVG